MALAVVKNSKPSDPDFESDLSDVVSMVGVVDELASHSICEMKFQDDGRGTALCRSQADLLLFAIRHAAEMARAFELKYTP